jgi:hypothetical protein
MTAQNAPPVNPARAIRRISNGPGVSAGMACDTNVEKIHPIMICPSPPIFQNFIRKATDKPKAVTASGIAIMIVFLIAFSEPRDPEINVDRVLIGSYPRIIIKRQERTSPVKSEKARIIYV